MVVGYLPLFFQAKLPKEHETTVLVRTEWFPVSVLFGKWSYFIDL